MIWEAGMAKTAADMVAEAKARVENLTVEQAAAEIEGGDTLLIDIREPDEHHSGWLYSRRGSGSSRDA